MAQPCSDWEHTLKWDSPSNNIIFDNYLADMKKIEHLSDVTISCNTDEYVKAHKLILSAASGFFEALFKTHIVLHQQRIVLPDVDYKCLKHLIDFIYIGEVKVLCEDVENVLALAKEIKIKGYSNIVNMMTAKTATTTATKVPESQNKQISKPTTIQTQNEITKSKIIIVKGLKRKLNEINANLSAKFRAVSLNSDKLVPYVNKKIKVSQPGFVLPVPSCIKTVNGRRAPLNEVIVKIPPPVNPPKPASRIKVKTVEELNGMNDAENQLPTVPQSRKSPENVVQVNFEVIEID